jgi:hypothetical protein
MRLSSTVDALAEARERTLALVAPLSDADVESQHTAIMSPLVWDLAHIAAYEELWLVHRHGGAPLSRPEVAAMYDAFETPRAVRGDLPLLDRAQALAYLDDVRERAPLEDSFVHDLVLRHEDQHQETMLQAIELARLRPAPAVPRVERPPAPGGHTGLEAVDVPAGPCQIGAPSARFAYDNERPRHRVELPAFRIGRTPVTNATFLSFVEGGGYERRPWWSDEAWAWKEEYDITHPQGWDRGPTGWRRWTLEGWGQAPHGVRVGEGGDLEPGGGTREPRPDAAGPGAGRRLPGDRRGVRSARDARRRMGVDVEPLPRLPRLRRPPLPRVLRGLLRRRVSRAARRLVGDALACGVPHLPQLGPARAAADLLRREAGVGRVTASLRIDVHVGTAAPVAGRRVRRGRVRALAGRAADGQREQPVPVGNRQHASSVPSCR